MATTKITSPDLFDLASLDSALQLPSGTTAERPTSPSTGEWRYNTTNNNIEFYDGSGWVVIADEAIPPIPSENFNVVLYNGTSATHAITGVGFQPDLVWIKDRNNGESHIWNDSTRGAGNDLSSNSINAQANRPTGFTSFDSDGFTLGTDGGGVVNDSTRGPYVAWCWKVGGGTTSSNTDGTITSTVQVNNQAGISIVEYTGNGSASQESFGHGLSSAPELIIQKNIDTLTTYGTNNWLLGGSSIGTAGSWLELNTQDAKATDTNYWGNQLPSSTVVYISGSTQRVHNENAKRFINYCFVEKPGFSKFGTYTGNGSATGPIINTGFEPAFVIIKRTDAADNWSMTDNARNTVNTRDKALFPNLTQSELTSGYSVNYLSNGFQIATSGAGVNALGGTFLYIAFASDPSTAPVLADSFDTTIYDGSGTQRNVSGLGFTPSMIWFKARTVAFDHGLYDSVRGGNSLIYPNLTQAASTVTNGILSFNSDGVTVGVNNKQNDSSSTYVGWAWKSNPIPTINTDGTIQTIVSANQAAGFSIVKYTGNATNDATVGHGLSQAPELWIGKQLTGSSINWQVLYSGFAEGDYLSLNLTNAKANSPNVSFDPTATTVKFQGGQALNDTQQNIGYAFHSVSGFSKVGTYVGNGSSSGPTVTTGFQPDFLMTKKATGIANWWMVDSARDTSNPRNIRLLANTSNSETSYSPGNINFNSTGFELAGTSGEINGSGETYIYMAFKENPAQPAIPSGEMAYLVVAGGGSGHRSDSNNGAGGGGAGGLRSSYVRTGGGGTVESNITLTAKTYTITIGAGGADNSTGGGPAISGSDSVLDTITSVGGGGGGGVGLPAEAATSGGSGGGGGGYNSAAAAAGTANQGFAGGNGSPSTSGTFSERNGGGGGGAGSVGTTGSTSSAGPGGIGVTVPITGTNVGYAGGGSGGNKAGSNIPGTDGGGSGAGTGAIGTAGTANTGGGGGGGGVNSYNGKGGGSGVVILRMNTSDYSGTTTGSPTVTTVGSETILTYTGSGTYVHS